MNRLASALAAMALAVLSMAATPVQAVVAAPTAFAGEVSAEERREILDLEIRAKWRRYVDRFITSAGRVIDNGNGDISHSEGQGYALILAAQAGDRPTFDLVLSWTERELFAGGQFAAWRWDPAVVPHITDANNATDGDILIAWGLMLAKEAFGEPAYGRRGEDLIRAIYGKLVIDTTIGPALTPGASGFSPEDFADGPIVNPSYWVFPALTLFADVTPDLDWRAVSETGYRLLREGRFGPLQLPTEWVALGDDMPLPAAEFAPDFSYNAMRIPLYLALDDAAPRDLLGPFVGMWNADEDIGPFVVRVHTGEAGELLGGQGYKAAFALADCMAGHRRVRSDFTEDDLYYPATLGLFALHKISEEFSSCL
ncbi:MAG TPA: glycosyl hydrolase family 8 [Methylomirabilota bacterium]|nr:glycosyl hydrolase family 8 [Methylomirabilota bacterium]